MRLAVLRVFYNFFFILLLPFIFVRLWVKGAKIPTYRQRWLERLGFPPLPVLESALWVHAVSVGEALSAVPLIHRFRADNPNTPILITTTTPTGSDRIQAAFKDLLGKQIYHCYLPYDISLIWHCFFKRVHPKLFILMETELWPNLLAACEQRNIPILIANARLSPKSVTRYQWLGSIMANILKPIHCVAAQSLLDKNRFHNLGIPLEYINDIGNIKFDQSLPAYLTTEGKKLRAQLGNDRQIWIAASTHEGEESILLEVYKRLKPSFPALLLLLVPRHPDRFTKVAELCLAAGLNIIKRSQPQNGNHQMDVFLGDTMGELPLFYAASDIAFVGGSLVPIGGHNLLEPAALGLPVISGPALFNFINISEMLIQAKGATITPDGDHLFECLMQLLKNPDLCKQQGDFARAVVEKNRGALDKLLMLIRELWSPQGRINNVI